MHRIAALPLALAALAMIGCGDAKSSGPAQEAAVPANDGAAVAPADPASAAAPAAAADEGQAAPASAPAVDLSAYVGRFPFDKVAGVEFMDHPRVAAAIAAALGDPALERIITGTPGPTAPIFLSEGRVGMWGCQQHNCGNHQWTVLIDQATGAAEVCYRKAEGEGGGSRWYRDGTAAARDGDCPAE